MMKGKRFPIWLAVLASSSSPYADTQVTNRPVLESSTAARIDLRQELVQPFQAGGPIRVVRDSFGEFRAYRVKSPPRNADDEIARRMAAFRIVRQMNMVRSGHRSGYGLPLSDSHVELLERFALSDAGAVWFRELVNETLRLLNQGYLQTRVQSETNDDLASLLTGQLSEKGQFAGNVKLFEISAYYGYGAIAQPGVISLGALGFKAVFPKSGEQVDPMAVLSHEFGHTRFGDPSTSGSIVGEAITVERYENPVRIRNGFAPRNVYYSRDQLNTLAASDTQGALRRLLNFSHDRSIRIIDYQIVEDYNCDCGRPIPLEAGCRVKHINTVLPGTKLDLVLYEPSCFVNWGD